MIHEEAIATFRDLSHAHFNIYTFRPIFMRAAWKAYRDSECDHILSDKFQLLIEPLFDSLFTESEESIGGIMIDIIDLFKNIQQAEQFLHNTFHIVFNIYVKSFYGMSGGWHKIIPFAKAIEHFITHILDLYGEDKSALLFQYNTIESLRELQQQNKSIIVLNTYCGVPIQYEAQIIQIDAESILIKAHPLQETAAVLENKIYLLKNEQLLYDAYATVIPTYVNGERLLKLSRFNQSKTSLFQRQSIRVHPSRSFILEVIHNAVHLKFKLHDISLGGVATISKYTHIIGSNTEATLHFPEEMMGQIQGVKGNLISSSSHQEGQRYHFKIKSTRQQEFYLGKYIAKRQQEIIKKLREEIV
jgi:hypothetical protein